VVTGAPTVVLADAQRGGDTLATDLPVMSGSTITVDQTAAVRRTCRVTLQVEDTALVPKTAADPLAPFGSELVIRSGFELPDGTIETVPVGVFRIEDTQSTSSGKIEIAGSDRSIVVAAARFEEPYTIASGTNVITAIESLINSRMIGLTYQATTSALTVPLTVYEEGDRSGDPWTNARDLAAAAGLEVFFDADGTVVIRPVPDPTVDPVVWMFTPGESSLVIETSDRFNSRDVRNVAVASGEGTEISPPVRATAEITDPDNPIYPAGPFGRRPVFFVSQLITDVTQAQQAADGLLLRSAGGSEIAEFSAAPHPALDGGDVVQLQDPLLAIDTYTVLDRFQFDPVLHSPIQFTTTARRAT